MANNAATQPGIKNSWTLVAFRKEFGPLMNVGEAQSKDEKGNVVDTWDSVAFRREPGARATFVSFSSKMAPLSAKQLTKQRDELQVVLLESGNYKICKQGESFVDSWEEVDEW